VDSPEDNPPLGKNWSPAASASAEHRGLSSGRRTDYGAESVVTRLSPAGACRRSVIAFSLVRDRFRRPMREYREPPKSFSDNLI